MPFLKNLYLSISQLSLCLGYSDSYLRSTDFFFLLYQMVFCSYQSIPLICSTNRLLITEYLAPFAHNRETLSPTHFHYIPNKFDRFIHFMEFLNHIFRITSKSAFSFKGANTDKFFVHRKNSTQIKAHAITQCLHSSF